MEKRVQDYSKEILKIIRSNTSPAVMGGRLQDYHENDLADVMPKLTVQERCKLYRILDTDMLSDIFEYTDEENAAEYLNEMDVRKAAAILSRPLSAVQTLYDLIRTKLPKIKAEEPEYSYRIQL